MKGDADMNILEYIEMLMDSGMSEEEASVCADILYHDDYDDGDDYHYYDDDMTQDDSWDEC